MVAPANVVHVLRIGQHAEEFDRMRSPAGSVAGQFLHHQHGPLAAAECDGVSDLRAWIVDARVDAIDRLVANQVADVGDHPLGARLDELVVV